MSKIPRGQFHGYECNCDKCWAKVARDNIAYGKKVNSPEYKRKWDEEVERTQTPLKDRK